MAIKVKHEGSAASRIAAAQQGGAAKRAMEAAALIKPTPIQTLAPAHASAPGIGGVHAQLISSPGGGAHAPLIGGGGGIGAHARMGGGGGRGGGAGSRVSTAGGGGGDLDYKVTGTSIFDRPDDESQWDPTHGGRWVRKWLPGEKEAEALGRVGAVKNAQEKDILDYKHQHSRDLAEQGALLDTERDIYRQRLKRMLNTPLDTSGNAAVSSPFPDAPAQSNGEKPELFNTLKNIDPSILNMRDSLKANGNEGPFDTGMSIALAAVSEEGQAVKPSLAIGGDPISALFDSLYTPSEGAETQGAADDLATVYGGGGSIFGSHDESGQALAWLNPPDMDAAGDGGDDAASNEYASSIGTLIGAFLHNV